jgi:hypothetical protein
MSFARRIGFVVVLVVSVPVASHAGGPYVGPIEYLSAADNPFPLATPGLCLETFEDGALTPGGVTGNGSFVGPGGITDSVDADDGSIDGSGNGGHTYFGGGVPGITFTFDPQRTGGLPTQAGMAWTDGGGTISFEALDQNGASLGIYGPFDHADGGVSGETAEDRFYGVTNAGGISAITLTNTSGGIEVDHLTLNNTAENCIIGGVTTTSTIVGTTSSTTTTTSTTTTVPAGCASVPVGPTFASLNCRLAALIAAVQAESQLGKQQPKLDKAAQKAKERKETAEAACAQGDTKAAGKQLKKVVRKMIQFSHRLRSNNARKNIPEEVREPLAETADEIQEDARELKDSLSCAG